RAGTAFPFKLNEIWELPFQLMDTALRSISKGSTEVERELITKVHDEVRAVGGALVLNWHSQTLNQAHFPEKTAQIRKVIWTAKRDGAWITTPAELIRHWSGKNGD